MSDKDCSEEKNFSPIIGMIHRKPTSKILGHPLKPFGMFVLMNVAIMISVTIMTLGDIRLAFLAILLGSVGPFITLFLSNTMAKWTFDIKPIDPDNFKNANERQIYHLVKTLAMKAGFDTPEVGVYKSPDINAFATGFNRNNALVAFSSALVDKMDEKELAAVAAHEIAHIANGDMLSMTIMSSAINTIINLISIGLYFALHDKRDGILGSIFKFIIRFAIVSVLMFLGNLLLLWFSRHREFKADKLAAELVNPSAMIKALNALKRDENTPISDEIAQSQAGYAAFKISSKQAALDIFSTHPSIERRIANLSVSKAS